MDWLVGSNNRSLDEFYRDKIIPLTLFGFGSINELLELKVYELEEAAIMSNDKDFQKSFMAVHGYNVKT